MFELKQKEMKGGIFSTDNPFLNRDNIGGPHQFTVSDVTKTLDNHESSKKLNLFHSQLLEKPIVRLEKPLFDLEKWEEKKDMKTKTLEMFNNISKDAELKNIRGSKNFDTFKTLCLGISATMDKRVTYLKENIEQKVSEIKNLEKGLPKLEEKKLLILDMEKKWISDTSNLEYWDKQTRFQQNYIQICQERMDSKYKESIILHKKTTLEEMTENTLKLYTTLKKTNEYINLSWNKLRKLWSFLKSEVGTAIIPEKVDQDKLGKIKEDVDRKYGRNQNPNNNGSKKFNLFGNKLSNLKEYIQKKDVITLNDPKTVEEDILSKYSQLHQYEIFGVKLSNRQSTGFNFNEQQKKVGLGNINENSKTFGIPASFLNLKKSNLINNSTLIQNFYVESDLEKQKRIKEYFLTYFDEKRKELNSLKEEYQNLISSRTVDIKKSVWFDLSKVFEVDYDQTIDQTIQNIHQSKDNIFAKNKVNLSQIYDQFQQIKNSRIYSESYFDFRIENDFKQERAKKLNTSWTEGLSKLDIAIKKEESVNIRQNPPTSINKASFIPKKEPEINVLGGIFNKAAESKDEPKPDVTVKAPQISQTKIESKPDVKKEDPQAKSGLNNKPQSSAPTVVPLVKKISKDPFSTKLPEEDNEIDEGGKNNKKMFGDGNVVKNSGTVKKPEPHAKENTKNGDDEEEKDRFKVPDSFAASSLFNKPKTGETLFPSAEKKQNDSGLTSKPEDKKEGGIFGQPPVGDKKEGGMFSQPFGGDKKEGGSMFSQPPGGEKKEGGIFQFSSNSNVEKKTVGMFAEGSNSTNMFAAKVNEPRNNEPQNNNQQPRAPPNVQPQGGTGGLFASNLNGGGLFDSMPPVKSLNTSGLTIGQNNMQGMFSVDKRPNPAPTPSPNFGAPSNIGSMGSSTFGGTSNLGGGMGITNRPLAGSMFGVSANPPQQNGSNIFMNPNTNTQNSGTFLNGLNQGSSTMPNPSINPAGGPSSNLFGLRK